MCIRDRGLDAWHLDQLARLVQRMEPVRVSDHASFGRGLFHCPVSYTHLDVYKRLAMDSDAALRRRLRHYVNPDLLVIDEIGYLSYSNRHADLLFELINRRYESKSTIVTTNKAFADWGEVFPNAACVVSLVDRLVHHSEVIGIEGESYRLKEAQARSTDMAAKRRKAKS